MSTTTTTPGTTGSRTSTRTSGRPVHRNALASQLDAEWATLANDPALEDVLTRWGAREPVLHGYSSLAEIRSACRAAGGDTEITDALLGALLRLHHAGEPLAGRTVLQLMQPQAVSVTNLAVRRTGEDLEEIAGLAYTALWQLICTYPLTRRPHSIAANLALDLRHEVTIRGGRSVGCSTDRHLPTEPLDGEATLDERRLREALTARAGSTDLVIDVRVLLVRARDAGVLSAAQAALLRDLYSPDHDLRTQEEVAIAWGISWATMRQRAARAVRRVATWAVTSDSLIDLTEADAPTRSPHGSRRPSPTSAAARHHPRPSRDVRAIDAHRAAGVTLTSASRHCILLGDRTSHLMDTV